jgi:hypothetical protein
MKKHLVFTLILTIIFPAYCFATPQRFIPLEDEILEEIMLIIEDGEVEEEEIASFLETVILIDADDGLSCTWKALISGVVLITLLLTQLDFSGSALEILLDVIILFYGTYSIVGLAYLFAYACDNS